MYSDLCQTSKMLRFAKIVRQLNVVNYLRKTFDLHVWQGSEYAYENFSDIREYIWENAVWDTKDFHLTGTKAFSKETSTTTFYYIETSQLFYIENLLTGSGLILENKDMHTV